MKERRLDKRSIALAKRFKTLTRDPDFQLKMWLCGLANTHNPYYAWKAIQVCIERNKKFPDWVLAYLSVCSERMFSKECTNRMKATKGHDLRKALPWIFGFPDVLDPAKQKKGPGNLLYPNDDPAGDKMNFALKFAIRLEEGDEPRAAMCHAGSEVFPDGVEEKTLWKWLLAEFDLKKRPRTADEWKAVAREQYSYLYKLLSDFGKKSRETLT